MKHQRNLTQTKKKSIKNSRKKYSSTIGLLNRIGDAIATKTGAEKNFRIAKKESLDAKSGPLSPPSN